MLHSRVNYQPRTQAVFVIGESGMWKPLGDCHCRKAAWCKDKESASGASFEADSAVYHLCDLARVIYSLSASDSLSIK